MYALRAIERHGIWCRIRSASAWGDFVRIVSPAIHDRVREISSDWGPIPDEGSAEVRAKRTREVREAYLWWVNHCCTPERAREAEAFRRHPNVPMHVSNQDLHLATTGLSFRHLCELVSGCSFEEIAVPAEEPMLPASPHSPSEVKVIPIHRPVGHRSVAASTPLLRVQAHPVVERPIGSPAPSPGSVA